jgi:uncharacterized protein YbaR (Trm112 family)
MTHHDVTEALYRSVEKWQRNASCRRIEEAQTGYLTCPLCALFYDRDCEGCPVMLDTGQALCRGTSYLEAAEAKDLVKSGHWPLSAFHVPAKEYADLLERLWRAS